VAELSAAALRPIGGSESVEADRLGGRVTHEIALRYRPGVQPSMRFRKGARAFHIVTVIDVVERRRWLKCFVRGARAVTAVTIKGLETLRRRLAGAADPQPIQDTLRAEAEAVAEEAGGRRRVSSAQPWK
jgi:SPP1 family predicted phage head-tail adaptor